jgi:hypothetical protein
MHAPIAPRDRNDNGARRLAWRRDGNGWLLLAGRRRYGRVVPDPDHAGMWRSVKSGERLSDTANLSWSKNAVLVAAERELEFEDQQRRAIDPSNCPERGVILAARGRPCAKIVRPVSDSGGSIGLRYDRDFQQAESADRTKNFYKVCRC